MATDLSSAHTMGPHGPDQGAGGAPIAALDLGTNNCRLLVARPSGDGGFEVIDAFSRNVRLGEGMELTGRLSNGAMRRTIDALRICAAKIDKHEVGALRTVATEACRRAANGAMFLDRVRRETGLALELVSPEHEARLAVAGCAPLLDPAADQLMVFDIGGGSTELLWIDLSGLEGAQRTPLVQALAPVIRDRDAGLSGLHRDAQSRVVDWISAPVGVATLHDRYLDVTDDRKRYALMSWCFEEQITSFTPYESHATAEQAAGLQLIGASGTMTTMASVHLGLRKYDRSKVDGLWINARDVARHAEHLIDLGLDGRARHPSVGRDRAKLVIAGVAILQTILRVWPTPRVRVADRGLREGLLYSLMPPGGHV